MTARLLEGEGDLLPVSALPVDGTFPTGTARWLKRRIAGHAGLGPEPVHRLREVRSGLPSLRDQDEDLRRTRWRTPGFLSKAYRSHDIADHLLTVQVLPDDCTGGGLCVEICPAHSKSEVKHKSLDVAPVGARRDDERPQWESLVLPNATRRGPP